MSDNGRYLVQLLLPVSDNDGAPFGHGEFAETRRELTDRFGGMTAHQRAPASGLWKTDDGEIVRDAVVIFEVVTADLDRDWWARYRRELERRFRQETLMVRAIWVQAL